MTRTTLHRLHNMGSQAAYDIGDDLPNTPIHHKETSRKMNQALDRLGEIRMNPKSRAFSLWQKVRSGAIKGAVVACIIRDHAKEFANFDKQAAMLNGKAAA